MLRARHTHGFVGRRLSASRWCIDDETRTTIEQLIEDC
jgi:hypothetical protein